MTTTDLEVSARLAIDVQVERAGDRRWCRRACSATRSRACRTPRSSSMPIRRRRRSAARRTRARCGCCRPRTSRRCKSPSGTEVTCRGGARSPRRSARWRGRRRATRRDRCSRACLLEISREGVTLVATDSYRLAVRDLVATARRRGEGHRPRARDLGGGTGGGADEKGDRRALPSTSARSRSRSADADAHVAADRGRVPELPQLLPEHVREPARRSRGSS